MASWCSGGQQVAVPIYAIKLLMLIVAWAKLITTTCTDTNHSVQYTTAHIPPVRAVIRRTLLCNTQHEVN